MMQGTKRSFNHVAQMTMVAQKRQRIGQQKQPKALSPLQSILQQVLDAFPVDLCSLVEDYCIVRPLPELQSYLMKHCPLLLKPWSSHKPSRDTFMIHEGRLRKMLEIKGPFGAFHVLVYLLMFNTGDYLLKNGPNEYGFVLHNLLLQFKTWENMKQRSQLYNALMELPYYLDDPSAFPTETLLMVFSLLGSRNYGTVVDSGDIFANCFSKPLETLETLETIAQRYSDASLKIVSWQSVSETLQQQLFFVLSNDLKWNTPKCKQYLSVVSSTSDFCIAREEMLHFLRCCRL